jgi:hypothetical protein
MLELEQAKEDYLKGKIQAQLEQMSKETVR